MRKLEYKDSKAACMGRESIVESNFNVGVSSGNGGRGEFIAQCRGDGPAGLGFTHEHRRATRNRQRHRQRRFRASRRNDSLIGDVVKCHHLSGVWKEL